jgi:AcrR family transcriptional regulator
MSAVRERILDAAYPLMTRGGVRAVLAEDVRRGADVTSDEFDEAFPSMALLAEAVLERRDRGWTIDTVESGARRRGKTPEARLLGIFDVLDEWFRRDDYEACIFINVLLEMGRGNRLGDESVRYLERVREMVSHLAEEARLERIDDFARSLHILMKGAIVSAAEGDVDAASRAREMAEHLVARHRPMATGPVPTSEIDLGWTDWEADELVSVRLDARRSGDAPEILDWMDIGDLELR